MQVKDTPRTDEEKQPPRDRAERRAMMELKVNDETQSELRMGQCQTCS